MATEREQAEALLAATDRWLVRGMEGFVNRLKMRGNIAVPFDTQALADLGRYVAELSGVVARLKEGKQ
jgi:hypothetical protein